MKISELIKELADVMYTHGDLPVQYFDNVSSYPVTNVIVALHRTGNALWITAEEQQKRNRELLQRNVDLLIAKERAAKLPECICGSGFGMNLSCPVHNNQENRRP